MALLHFAAASSHLTAINEEDLAGVGILLHLQFLNLLLGFELLNLPRLDKFQTAFHSTNLYFEWLWRGTIPTAKGGERSSGDWAEFVRIRPKK